MARCQLGGQGVAAARGPDGEATARAWPGEVTAAAAAAMTPERRLEGLHRGGRKLACRRGHEHGREGSLPASPALGAAAGSRGGRARDKRMEGKKIARTTVVLVRLRSSLYLGRAEKRYWDEPKKY